MVGSPDNSLPMLDEYGVSLSAALALLRSELETAIDEGRNCAVRFSMESIEVELEVAVKATAKAEGKVGLWQVLSASGSRETADSAKHRLKLVLTPHDMSVAADTRTLIGDDE
jgi:Trypsin-co-occurring domain 2